MNIDGDTFAIFVLHIECIDSKYPDFIRRDFYSTKQAWVNKGDVYKIITGHERLPSTKRQVEIETETPRHSPGADFLLPADCFLHTCLVGATYCCSVGVDLPPYKRNFHQKTTSLKRCHFAYIWGKDAAKLLKEIGKGVSFSKCGFQKGDNRMYSIAQPFYTFQTSVMT